MSRSMLLVMLAFTGCNAAQQATLGNVDTNLAVETTATTAGRKVIFEATIRLIVSDMDQLEREIPKLARDHGGFLAQVGIDRRQREQPTGHWVVRIPVKQYEAFLPEVTRLGVVDTFDQKSQDVTEEYVDLQARITNEKRLEDRIVELLKKPDEGIKTVIEIEHELARVRGEIEKMEGRLRFLANRTEMTTVTIDAFERKPYVPVAAPNLWTRVHESWWSSLSTIGELGEAILVSAAGMLPWLPFLAILIAPVVWIARQRAKRRLVA